MQPESRKPFQKPFQKTACPQAFSKRLERKPEKRLSLSTLSPNPIGVIKRRNVCGSTVSAQQLQKRFE
jgi:hypothetical protein